MNKGMLALAAVILLFVSGVCSCGTATVTTKTETLTTPGAAMTQTISITGPVTTISVVPTPGPSVTTTQTVTSIITTTITGPITTVTTTQTGIITQGFTYVSGITPATPATLHFNDWVQVSVEYAITDPGGARMWAIPMTNGQNTAGGGYSASGLMPAGRGSVTLSFSVASGAVKVDQIHLLMKNAAQSATLFEAFVPVNYSYAQ